MEVSVSILLKIAFIHAQNRILNTVQGAITSRKMELSNL